MIRACDWILANKATYNIQVANFSLHSASVGSVMFDPLDQAVEKLWLNGVVVVAAAGNYGTGSTPSGVLFAPGNDPFVITVGATDIGSSSGTSDDSVAPWSAYGYTPDGFAKPDLSAPGRYMIGPVPSTATLPLTRPDKVTAPGYMQLSGTSFSAPMVSAAAATLKARNPSWTPDQVKGALMVSATSEPIANRAVGVGDLNIGRLGTCRTRRTRTPRLDRYLTTAADGTTVFNASGLACRSARQPDVGHGGLVGRGVVGRGVVERRLERRGLGRRSLGDGCLGHGRLERRCLGGCRLERRGLGRQLSCRVSRAASTSRHTAGPDQGARFSLAAYLDRGVSRRS